MTMKSGMIPSWVGMAIVAMTKIMSLSRPWNRSFANAYPAMVENVTREIVTIVETRRLFPRAFQNGIAFSTVCTLAMKFGPGMKGSGSPGVGGGGGGGGGRGGRGGPLQAGGGRHGERADGAGRDPVLGGPREQPPRLD